MRHLVNVFGLFLLLLGFVMVTDTVWGWGVMAIPIVFWLMRLLNLIHKNRFAALVFWLGVTFVYWQFALALFSVFLLITVIRFVKDNAHNHPRVSRKRKSYNPATGLPMMGHKGIDVDSNGNPYNTF